MIASVFKPSRIRDGKRVRQKNYVAQIKMEWDTRIDRIPLSVSDK